MSMRPHRHGWYALGLLAIANFLNYGNRNIVFPMYEDLRARFDFSNADLGLLGTAFMLPHAMVSLPLGWAGDRFDRRRVIALSVVVWSLASAASAMSRGLISLLASRALVGMATAACVPLASSLLCDLFPPGDKARTVSIFNLGLFVGGAVGFAAGALLGFPRGILVVAAPGLVVAALVARVDVPEQRHQGEAGSWRAFVRRSGGLLAIPTLRWTLAGAALMSFAAGGYLSWMFELLAVTKGMGSDRASVLFGVCLAGGLAGVLTGGIVADRLARSLDHGRLAALSMGMLGTVPFALVTLYVDVGALFYVSSWLTMFFITWYHGPLAAVIHDLVQEDRAATAQALALFLMHCVGTAPSSWVVGTVADAHGLREAMLVPTGAVLLAALVLTGGWRTMAADRAAAGRGVDRSADQSADPTAIEAQPGNAPPAAL